jgi:hypothetical protein
MSANEQIIFDVLIANGYNPEQVFFRNTFPKKSWGWFASINGNDLYLGQRINSALYNIENNKIKPLAHEKI